VFICYISYFFN